MTVVTRKRSGNFAVVPNAIAEDERLSFEARGLLVYLLAKPHDWKVQVGDIRRSGKIGRDKAYKLLKELRDTGYIVLEQQRDAGALFGDTNYVVYDVAIPAELPLPENPEAVAPRPEKPEAEEPHPPLPDTEKPRPVKPDALLKTQPSPNPHSTKSPSTRPPVDALFDELVGGWKTALPDNVGLARSLFVNLPADVERQNAVRHAALWHRIQTLRKKPANLITYLKMRPWRELVDAPDVDKDGDFIITPDREEWSSWMDDVTARYGAEAARRAAAGKRIVRPTRWPATGTLQHRFDMETT